MIELKVNGVPYTDFVTAEVTISLETLANDFAFRATAVDAFPPFKRGDFVVATVNGETKCSGYIEEVNGIDQEGSHTVLYSGRDRTGDFIDSQINTINDISASGNLTLKRIIERVLSHINLNISVIDNLSPAPFNEAEDVISPEVGDECLDFVMQYAQKRQALLTSNGDGNIVITQSSPTDSGAVLQRLASSDTNNILAQSWVIDGKAEYNKYILRGQLDPRATNFGGDTDIAAVENQGSEVANSSIRAGRQQVIVEGTGYSAGQLSDRAKWTSQLAKARATRFNCTVKDHEKPNGGLWEENTLVLINSDVADISRKMLVNTITFSQQEGGSGQTTSLEFVERDVYTINEQILAQRKTGSQNDIFTL